MTSPSRQTDSFPMAVVVEGALALLALALAWLFRVELRTLFPDDPAAMAAALGRGFLATLPMLAGFWWLVRSSRAELVRLRQQVEWMVGELFPTSSYTQFALIAILAGVAEELLFRGVIQTVLAQWTDPLTGLAIASLLFGAAHALSRLYFLLATLIGAYLGWIMMHYDDLVAPMVAHGLYDFLALVYLARRRRPPSAADSIAEATNSEPPEVTRPADD